jgi:hypothetical protein
MDGVCISHQVHTYRKGKAMVDHDARVMYDPPRKVYGSLTEIPSFSLADLPAEVSSTRVCCLLLQPIKASGDLAS